MGVYDFDDCDVCLPQQSTPVCLVRFLKQQPSPKHQDQQLQHHISPFQCQKRHSTTTIQMAVETYDSKFDSFKLTGVGKLPATHEIHIFLGPLNPDEETVAKYKASVEKWNFALADKSTMKACLLCLYFRDAQTGVETPVVVMQSAVYVHNNSTQQVIESCHAQAKFFRAEGFEVLREKIEASVYGINGIPQVPDEFPKEFTSYFEFHIKIKVASHETDSQPCTEEELAEIRKQALMLSWRAWTPIPLSYNINKDKLVNDGLGSQIFLNVRFRDDGLVGSVHVLEFILNAIKETKTYQVSKVISEYVWYDTYPEMDLGWIEFHPGEKQTFMKKIRDMIFGEDD